MLYVISDKMDTEESSNSKEDEEISLRSNYIQMAYRFEEMKLKPRLLKNLSRMFKRPLAIQCKAMKPSCLGKDVLLVAPRNSGKTSTAIISILNKINFSGRKCQAVFIVNDTSTANKVKNHISTFSFEQKYISTYIYDLDNQTEDDQSCFTKGTQLIIGTPKSLLTLFSIENYVEGYRIETVVIDEAESTLSSENIQYVTDLLQQYIHWTSQLIVLSTNISKEMLYFAGECMADPIRILVNSKEELVLLENDWELHYIAEECTERASPIRTDSSMELDLKNTTAVTETTHSKNMMAVTGTIPPTDTSVDTHKHEEQFQNLQEDEFDLVGKLITMKLRNLPADNRAQIGKIFNFILFDTKNCDINKLITNVLPEFKKSQSTQTDSYDFYNKEFDLCNDKLLTVPPLNQIAYNNVTHVKNVKWIKHFEDAPLERQVKSGILYDFKNPLLLQQKSLKLLLKGYDMLIQSPADSGKTTAVIIASLNAIDVNKNECQSVIVVPNLDLVYTTRESVNNLSQYVPNFKCRPVSNPIEFKNYSNSGAHMIITVPEFIISMLDEQFLNTNHIKLFIIEQIDEICKEISSRLIQQLMKQLSVKVQIILTQCQTANLTPIHLLKRHFLQIIVTPEDLLLNGVKQYCMYVRNEERKYNMLGEAIKKLKDVCPIVVFCNTIRECAELSKRLNDDGVISAVSLTDKLNAASFREFMEKFETKSKKILITTDYCATSVDIERVPLVINFMMPFKHEFFIQRIRRSGRYKHKNYVINFATNEERGIIIEIQRTYDIIINEIGDWIDLDFSSFK